MEHSSVGFGMVVAVGVGFACSTVADEGYRGAVLEGWLSVC